MGDPVEDFLAKHRSSSKWLDDIVDVLLTKPHGTAHVNEIARDLWSSERRDIDSIEETITRRINDYCGDAADFDKTPDRDLFERVIPATYRLRSFPEKPDIYELAAVRFDEPAMRGMWDYYGKLMIEKFHEKWGAATNRKRLEAFVKWMAKPKQQEWYEERKKSFAEIASISFDDLLEKK
jgi:hypothetical protein